MASKNVEEAGYWDVGALVGKPEFWLFGIPRSLGSTDAAVVVAAIAFLPKNSGDAVLPLYIEIPVNPPTRPDMPTEPKEGARPIVDYNNGQINNYIDSETDYTIYQA